MFSPDLLRPEDVIVPESHLTYEREKTEKFEKNINLLVNRWLDFLNEELKPENRIPWVDLKEDFKAKYFEQKNLIESKTFKNIELKNLLLTLNRVFGLLPTSLIDVEAELNRMNFVTDKPKDVTQQDIDAMEGEATTIPKENLYMIIAGWQNDAIVSLSKIGAMEASKEVTNIGTFEVPPGRKMLPEILIPIMLQVMKKGLGPKIYNINYESIMTGVYGPVKLARIFETLGCEAYIAPTQWDAQGSIDMIIKKKRDDGTVAYSTLQVKTTSLQELPKVSLSDTSFDFNSELFFDNCEDIRAMDGWNAQGIDIFPYWAIIDIADSGSESFKRMILNDPEQSVLNDIGKVVDQW